MTYELDTSQRSVVYMRPAITRIPSPAEGAGVMRAGVPFYNENAAPLAVARIIVYPDAAGTLASPRVVLVMRNDGLKLGRFDMLGQTRKIATEAEFAAEFFTGYIQPGSDPPVPPTKVDFIATVLEPCWRWQRTENAKAT